jgi:hypothetical protein
MSAVEAEEEARDRAAYLTTSGDLVVAEIVPNTAGCSYCPGRSYSSDESMLIRNRGSVEAANHAGLVQDSQGGVDRHRGHAQKEEDVSCSRVLMGLGTPTSGLC